MYQDVRNSLGNAIRHNCDALAANPAVVATGRAPLTYAGLGAVLDDVHGVLRASGFGACSRIGVMVREPALAALSLVAVSCSAVAVPLDPRLTASEIDRFLPQLQLDALLVEQGEAQRWEEGLNGLPIIELVDGPALTIKLELRRDGIRTDSRDQGDTAFILLSSGTTGTPKLVPFSHGNMLAAASRWKSWFGITPEDRCLCVSAPHYSHGLKVTIFTPLVTGGSIAFPAAPTRVDLQEWLGQLSPTWFSCAPAVLRAMAEAARDPKFDPSISRLRFVSTGGAHLPATVRSDFETAFKVPVLEHYGSSEAAQIAANTPAHNKPGTVGRPWPGVVQIVDPQGHPVATGERGEIIVRGPTVAPGYLGADGANLTALLDGTWQTGDVGSLDEDGFLTLHGRQSELINRGGEKVSPAEVEAALAEHPDVADSAVFGIAHRRLGEDVAAAVIPRQGATIDPPALRRFLSERLAPFKIPRRIVAVSELPRGRTGKIQRQAVAAALASPRAKSDDESRPEMRPGSAMGSLELDLLAVWMRLLETDHLDIDDSFFEKGGDSLLATEALVEVERLIGCRLPDTTFAEVDTIRQLAARIANMPEVAPTVVRFGSPDADQPLFWFHGDFDDGGYYVRRLSGLLGPEHPIASISPHPQDTTVSHAIEAMAADRIGLIREIQAHGPYKLGGHCNGGLVALEAARLLRDAGEEVELVAMIDPPSTVTRPYARAVLNGMRSFVSPYRVARIFEDLSWLEAGYRLPVVGQVRRAQAEVMRRLRRKAPPTGAAGAPEPAAEMTTTQFYSFVMSHYRPRPLAVPVLCLSADFDGEAWRMISPDFRTVQIPGGHNGCLADHAALIAHTLEPYL